MNAFYFFPMTIILIPVLIFLIFLLLLIILTFFFLAIDVFLDLPYVATERFKIDTIFKFAQIKKGETVIDLGSGDGRLLFAAAAGGAKAVGYEINPFMVIISRIHASLKGLAENIRIYKKNLWQADLKVADVIFVYGRRKTMQKFEDFVFKNAKKGTRIVVNTNPFPNKKPIKSEKGLFLYKV
ncbi:hypothetical protein A3F02_00990 [Candidatus Curtissbacteria bacterium RIFCSPHIGHO2_12_FULL_38_9b]|uniref:Methyltransferase domain-containing protein n=1 Tax=Candidatus Curtissbacteria bacterium RIFCSPHIGHO2_12_FULL_38_9b TaxID=1797720 RepID=A0A1F5GVI8_9BACT|nr:MAG: hypothetical protein A3F02_00990 [Candidatus Curtissbacteria bacterium RIFCSPHIGHO2_12_FULL_38_9b]